MKKILLYAFLLLFITTSSFAQTAHVFDLNRLSQRDTLVSGWVFHTGDNADWSKPGADDKGWKAVDPSIDVAHFTELKNAGIGWLRLHIRVDSSLVNKTLAVSIIQYTASEVYLNGQLINQYGIVSTDPKNVKAYLPSTQPFPIKLKPGADNVLAVRLAYQPNVPYASIFFTPLPVFNFYVNDQHAALFNYNNDQHLLTMLIIIFSIAGGITLIIGFIYLVYFLFDRSQKVYLYYALFMLALSSNSLPIEIFGIDRFGPVASQMWVFFIEGEGLIAGMLFMLMTIYKLFEYPNRIIFKGLILLGVVLTVLMYLQGTLGQFGVSVAFPIICVIEGTYVCVWAIKRHKKDAGIILAGILLFVMCTILYSVVNTDSVLAQSFFNFGQIFFPIGMSFYFGIQNALTNKSLKASLVEVQMLSEQKQQILADQNILLEHQVEERTAELNQSLTDLRATQTQLVQREKMASLGELTAGIAHEIQNPLNFVNNFSDVNREMIDELKEELKKGDVEEALAIAGDIQQNEEKINHHGKRADFIVKGMLLHSRNSSGEKELTNINTMANEFFKLSYQGLRAKDKNFNAELVTHFDAALPKVNIAQQDIGRVLLNLFNNAFYAVNQKMKAAAPGYKPEVLVSTSTVNGQIIIKVKDNGNGIPDAIKDKIMQPFFTTKPTGEGTGLGLSLSYDIVVKGHGGSISVDTKENEFTEFTVSLPIN